jgi:Flp pilus assembly protein TadD
MHGEALEAGETLAAAHEALAAQRWPEAVELFRLSLAGEGDVDAHRGLARALAAWGREGEAIAGLRRSVDALLAAGRWAAAETLAEEALSLAPGSPGNLARLGRARVFQEEYATAEGPLQEAVDGGQRDPATLLALAGARWENGRVPAAVAAYELALTATARAPAVLHSLGRLLAWAGRYEEALAPLEEARRGLSQDALLLIDLARALDGAGRSEEAIGVYRQALALAPEQWEARYRLGLLLLRAGAAAEGEEQHAIYRRQQAEQRERERLAGRDAARLEEARWQLTEGDVAAAERTLDGLAEGPDVLLVRGLARLAADDGAGALALLRRAVALAPDREDLRAQLTAVRLAVDGR